ncbi:MAG: hypothetical protein HY741_08245 [Chloroflexi bacterium]|nr:hypothetical protein [Chloroflexota bacterium]
MKLWLSLGLVFSALWLAIPTAHADSPVNSEPATASYINGQPQTIPANSTQWYKFDYAGDKSLITILMPHGTNSLVEFNVFTPEQAQSWWEPQTKPIGRGTPYSIDCASGKEVYWGECKSADLKWKGQFIFPGTFYVQVVNYNTGTANFTLTIQGTGVSVGPGAPSSAPAPKPLLPVTGGVWQNAPVPDRLFPQFRRE